MTEGEGEHRRALEEALVRGEHPARGALVALLGDHLTLPERDLHAILAERGPVEGDALTEVARRLDRHAEAEGVLRRRIADLERQAEQLSRLANRTTAVAAILAVVAIMGWLAALGLWDIDWLEPPAPPDDQRQEQVNERR